MDADGRGSTIDAVVAEMESTLAAMPADDARRHFHAVYLRTTRAVGEEARAGGFVDGDWVEAWDAVFARLYLDALAAWEAGRTPRAWAVPFRAARDERFPELLHVLFGMNVHINVDLPQALLAVISDDELDDPVMRAHRERDHRRIDDVLVRRIAAEEKLLPPGTLLDRLIAPLNRWATARFLTVARREVWRNTLVLSAARRRGPDDLARAVDELDRRSAGKVAQLARPGPVLLRLAVRGFGVRLPAGA